MFQNKKILGVITARGGSKGVPGKNIRPCGGKPLIAWIIEAAQQSSYIDRLILSSDDKAIIDVAKQRGCEVPFVRPAHLADDDSLTIDVVLHAIELVQGYDMVVLLQPTSPLTLSEDIDGCIRHCITSGSKSAITVTDVDKNPFWMFKLDNDGYLQPLMNMKYLNKRRQDLPPVFLPTGAVYVAEAAALKLERSFYTDRTAGYRVPRSRSMDIDSELDFILFEILKKDNRNSEDR